MECEQCKGESLEVVKQEIKQKYNYYYNDFDDYTIVHLKCKDCGCEFIECV